MKRFEHQWQDFKWVDCENPQKSDLISLAEEFKVPVNYLATSLEPEHLVKCEFIEDKVFLILRAYDETVKDTENTIQDLTSKLVFFIGPDFALTLHRSPIRFVAEKIQKVPFEKITHKALLQFFFSQSLLSFDQPLTTIESKTAIIEERIYSLRRKNILREGYIIKRRASAYKKILKFSMESLVKMQNRPEFLWENFRDLKDYNDRMIFYADDVIENITGLLNLHISLMSQKTNEASYRTNEVMRILTLVSIFFLPLNFIAGIYGMNFENMPELSSEHGYYYTLGFMVFTALGIFLWIYRKGWIRSQDV